MALKKEVLENAFKLSFIMGLFFVISCAHHRDVRPGVEGVHRVVIQTDDQEEGNREAISQANHYCEEKGKSAAFMTEDKKYTGSMKESDYKTAKTASKIAGMAGSAAYVFGGKNESAAGGIVGMGGAIADSVIGKGYTVEMKFKCQ